MIDFHSHILPGIDDGSKSIEESIKILIMLQEQGVDTVIATPHYYDSAEHIDAFLVKRNSSYKRLMDAVNEEGIIVPEILLGAEVYLSPDVAFDKDFYRLCVGDTKCILIEMPNGFWFDWVYYSIEEIINQKKLIPIIAHLERYASWSTGIKTFDRLLELNVFIQINADSFDYMGKRVIIKKLFKANKVHLIGTDAHNTTTRSPKMLLAHKKIVRRYGAPQWDLLHKNAKALLNR